VDAIQDPPAIGPVPPLEPWGYSLWHA